MSVPWQSAHTCGHTSPPPAVMPEPSGGLSSGELAVLLQQAQNIRSVSLTPWRLIPALFVIVTVLCFNFVGDGLRDAGDPTQDR